MGSSSPLRRQRRTPFTWAWWALAVLTVAVLLLLGHVQAHPVEAQGPATAVLQQEDAGSDPESNLPFLFAAFGITWVGFFAYLYVVSRRQQELRREVEALRRALAEREGQVATEGTASEEQREG